MLIKARVLFRDLDAQQPKWECPKRAETGVETICLRYPNAYTVAVREVLMGQGIPRRLHAILWVHSSPPEDTDIYLAGTRQPSGEVEAFGWGDLEYVGCDMIDEAERLHVMEQVKALQQAKKLPCVPR